MSNLRKKIRTIFIGTPDFAIPAFKAIMNDEQFSIVAVITQPDRKVGRKQLLTPPPVKEVAQSFGIPVLQPEKILEMADKIKDLNPELIIVVAYAQLIPEEILKIPKYGCINVHGSLLPKYRGAAVIQAAILNNDRKTGVTIMKMDKGLDTGPILARDEISIKLNDTAGTLYDKLSQLGAELLITTLRKYIANKIKPRPQNKSQASYVRMLSKKDGAINWSRPAVKIERFIRAMTPWPSAWSLWKDKRIKITEAQPKPLAINSYRPGKTFIYNSGLVVQCGQDALIIKSLQLAGKKEVTSKEFLLGYKNFIGSILS